MSRSLLLRWSWRDLRERWLAVLVIATIIAIGTGVFAGLGSTGRWRRMSNDASYAALVMHDLEVELSPGTTTDEGRLAAMVASLPAGSVVGAQERLQVGTQVDASTEGETVLVPGLLVGTDPSAAAGVDRLAVRAGDRPAPGALEVVVEEKFADHYGLQPGRALRLSGSRSVPASGLGVTPEHFLVTGESEGGFLAEANFAVLYTSLTAAQELAGQPGQVNDLVLALSPDADGPAVRAALDAAVADLPGVSATVSRGDEETSYRLLYDDIDGDQQVWNALSALVLAAASLAAFNLVGRIVDAQRREIGVQMALGVPPARISSRPVLVGAQIALIGVVLGVVVGLLVGAGMRGLLTDLLPLPVWRTPFQPSVFAAAALLGFVIPFVASVLPVRRAVRMEPVQAIRTAHQPASERRLSRCVGRIHVPGSATAQLPLRNLLRSPRRTVLTAVGVGAAIAALVGVLGMLDSFRATIAEGERELTREAPDRVIVQLSSLTPADGPSVAAVTGAPEVGTADLALELPATVRTVAGDRSVPVIVDIGDLDGASWTPTIEHPVDTGGAPTIVLTEAAAEDLDVGPGDVVVVRHPALDPTGGLTQAEDQLVVGGLHPSPLRAQAYIDADQAGGLGIPPLVNRLEVRPAAGATVDELRAALFALPGVASAQPVGALTKAFDDAVAQFVGFLVLTSVAVMVMALLIAFNSTSISMDERTREHATLFAFGLPVRTVVRMAVVESVLVGALATVVGVLLGRLLVRWVIGSVVADTLPEIGLIERVSVTTVLLAIVVGVVVVGLTPLLAARRLRRMVIPDALRVME